MFGSLALVGITVYLDQGLGLVFFLCCDLKDVVFSRCSIGSLNLTMAWIMCSWPASLRRRAVR